MQEYRVLLETAIAADNKQYGVPTAGQTREWNNRHCILEWQLRHKLHIKRLIHPAEYRYTKKYMGLSTEDQFDVFECIGSPEFWEGLQKTLDETIAFKKSLNVLQGDSRNLADVFLAYTSLIDEYTDLPATGRLTSEQRRTRKVREAIKNALCSKWDLISSDMHAAVFFSDWRMLDEVFVSADMDDAEKLFFLSSYSFLHE